MKKAKKDYFDQQQVCEALVHWLNYTMREVCFNFSIWFWLTCFAFNASQQGWDVCPKSWKTSKQTNKQTPLLIILWLCENLCENDYFSNDKCFSRKNWERLTQFFLSIFWLLFWPFTFFQTNWLFRFFCLEIGMILVYKFKSYF